MNARQQRADRGITAVVALEMLQRHAVVQQCPRQTVLHAELGIELALRVWPIGMCQAPRMRPRVDAFHHRRRQFMLADE
jgi:hypothetical protein